MATTLTKESLFEELEKERDTRTLSEILRPEQFAEPGRLADQLAKEFKDALKPTQLRKIFHAIKEIERKLKVKGNDSEDIESEDRNKVSLLIPELAYATGRELIPKDFYRLMRLCMGSDKLKTVGDFRRLVEFLTAILAYHKFHEKVKDEVKGGRR